jgi:hypothetical protein
MSDNQHSTPLDAEGDLEREIREGRKFTLEEAIGRLAGPGAMKGESPIGRLEQAEIEIGTWLSDHLTEGGGVLDDVLHRRIKGSELLLNNFSQPLVALADYCRQVLDSDYLLTELVRECDIEWGRVMGERPYFEKADSPSNPDDPYTAESTRKVLFSILEQLAASQASETSKGS